jgi:DNA-binding protein H-NS
MPTAQAELVDCAPSAAAVTLCATCGERPRLGSLRRCLPCLQRDVDAQRRHDRAARAPARSRQPAAESSTVVVEPIIKACRACGVLKPLTAFARHGSTTDGRRHHCRDCKPPRQIPRIEKLTELQEANAKLTALLHEAYAGIRGGFKSVIERRSLLARINQGLRWLSEVETPERPPPMKRFKPPVRYRNPANPTEQWSGRGKMPRWLKAKLEAGAALVDFKLPAASA